MFTVDDPENLTVERMTRLWATFAAKGNPNDPTDEYLNQTTWQPTTKDQPNYLDIGNELVMKANLNIERYNVWNRLFPINYSRNKSNSQKNQLNEIHVDDAQ